MTETVESHIDTSENISVESLTERVEFLRDNPLSDDEKAELKELEALLADLEGNGGDHQWEGNWYPAYLIRESNFVDAMKELCDDIGDIPKELPSYVVIDWEATAKNLRVDYSEQDIDGVTFLYR